MVDIQRAHTHDNPLMQPVQYNGQEYFCSQYFHQQYLTNSQHSGKYRQHTNFLHVVRAIPTYPDLVQGTDIVELDWQSISASKDVLNTIRIYFKPLFHLTGYRPLTLLNATAQAALIQHLEDETSRALAMTVNTTVAQQASRKSALPLTRMQLVDLDVKAGLSIAASFGVPVHIAQQETVKFIEAEHGMNLRPLLLAAPAQDNIPVTAKMLEPMDLANEFGWGRTIQAGAQMNKHLEGLGWQIRKVDGGWEATPTGGLHCSPHAYTADHGKREGYNLKWNVSAVRQALGLEVQHG